MASFMSGFALGFMREHGEATKERNALRADMVKRRLDNTGPLFDDYRKQQAAAQVTAKELKMVGNLLPPGSSLEHKQLALEGGILKGDPKTIAYFRELVETRTPGPTAVSPAGQDANAVLGNVEVTGGPMIGGNQSINMREATTEAGYPEDFVSSLYDPYTPPATGSTDIVSFAPGGSSGDAGNFDAVLKNLEDSRNDLNNASEGKAYFVSTALNMGNTQEQVDAWTANMDFNTQQWGVDSSRYSHNQFIGEFFGRTKDYRNARDARAAALSLAKARGANPQELELLKNLDYTKTQWGDASDAFDLAKSFKSFIVNSHLFKDEAAARAAMTDHVNMGMLNESEEFKQTVRDNLATVDLSIYTWGDQALIRASEKAKADEAAIVATAKTYVANGMIPAKANMLARGLSASYVDSLIASPSGGVHETPDKFLTESDTKNIRNEVGHALATSDTKGIWNVLDQFSSFGNLELNEIASNVNNMAAIEWGKIVKASFISGQPIDPKDNIFAIVNDMKSIQLALYAAQKINDGIPQQAAGSWGGGGQSIKDLDKVGQKLHEQIRASGATGKHAASLITSASNHFNPGSIDLAIYTGWATRHDGTAVLHK